MKVKCGRPLFYLFILLLPIQLGKHFWPPFSYVSGLRIDYLSPTLYLTDIIVLIMGGYFIYNQIKDQTCLPARQGSKIRTKIRNVKISKYVLFCCLLLIVNVVFAGNPFLALFKLLKIAELAFVVLYIKHYKPSLRIAVYCLLFTICYSSIIAWLQLGKQASMGGFLWFLGERTFNVTTPGIARIGALGNELLRPYATFPHPNVLAGYLVTTVPLIFAINMKRQLKVPLILFIIATIGITFSRSAWMGLALIGLLPAVKQIPANKKTVVIAILVIIASGLLIVQLVNRVTFSTESFTIRNELNGAAISMWRDHPLFGVGLNNFIPTLPSYLRIDNFQSLQPVHNGYLLIAAETGIVGVSLLIYLLCMASTTLITNVKFLISNQIPNHKFQLRKIGSLGIGNSLGQPARRQGGLEIRSIRNYAMLSLLIILFLALFDHYFFTLQQTQLLLALIIGFIFSFNQTANKRYNKSTKSQEH